VNSLLKGVTDPMTDRNSLGFVTLLVPTVDRQDKSSMATRNEAAFPFLDYEAIFLAHSLSAIGRSGAMSPDARHG